MNLRKIIFWTHLTAGLTIGSVLLVMAVTGTLLAFQPQITALAEKNVRKAASGSSTERLSLNVLTAKAGEAADGRVMSGLKLFADPEASVEIQWGKEGSLFIDPYSGKILGSKSQLSRAMDFILNLHRQLALGETGQCVTGICVVAFLGMIASGIFLWWPKQWKIGSIKAILFFRKNLSGKARDWNWHNVIGFWCAPLLLVTALTGTVMAHPWANDLLFWAAGTPPVLKSPAPAVKVLEKKKLSEPPAAIDLQAMFETLRQKNPAWQSVSFRLPAGPGSPPQVTAWLTLKGAPPFFRGQLLFDAQTGAVIREEPFAAQSRGRQARAWIVPLHTGQAWGIGGQMLMLLSALGTLLLIYTGFSLSWRRFFRSK